MTISFRPMQEQDIPAIMLIQRAQYTGRFIESEAVFRERLKRSPDTCWVTTDTDGVCAYLFGYHSVIGRVIPLGADFVAHENADCLYIHDLAVLPRTVGRNIGRNLIRLAWKTSADRGIRHSALISVLDSFAFWERLGYRQDIPPHKGQEAHLAGYGEGACYMTRSLD